MFAQQLSTRDAGMTFWPPIPLLKIANLIGYKIHSLPILMPWYEATQERPGNFSGDDRSRVFLSLQTYKGLQITAHSSTI